MPFSYQMLPHQRAFHKSNAAFRALVGGYGSGKSMASVMEAILCSLETPGAPGILVAPTFQMLRDTLYPMLISTLEKMDVEFTEARSEFKVKLPWGSEVWFKSGDAPDRMRGSSLAWAGLDEAAYMPREVFEIAASRLRHPSAKKPRLFITTTPEGYNWLWEEFCEKHKNHPEYALIRARTIDNPHLPAFYVERLKDVYSGPFLKQYLDGEFVCATEGLVFPQFSRSLHLKAQKYDASLPVLCGMDFNVDPMTCVVGQLHGEDLFLLKEIVLPHSSTEEMAPILRREFPEAMVYADYTGRARNHVTGKSDLDLLREFGFSVKTRRIAHVKDKLHAVNRRLRNALSDETTLYFHPEMKKTISSFEKLTWDSEGRGVDKRHGHDHLADCVAYLVYGLDTEAQWRN